MLGFKRYSLDQGFRSKRISDRETPVVLCGAIRYANKAQAIRVLRSPYVTFFSPVSRIWTARSANPFKDG